MATITTRSGKGSPLTNNEVDANFTNLNTDKIELTDLSVGAEATPSGDGSIAYNNVSGVFTYTPPESVNDITGAVKFSAQAGEALAKGDVVYVSGVSGNNPVVSKADADDASKMPAYGLAETAVSANATVNVVTFGTIADIDTSSFSVGDTIYVSTTAGGITATKPAGESSLIQNIGRVIRVHATAGSIKVGGAGRTNDTPNLNDGNVFIGNASNQAEARALVEADISDFGTYLTSVTFSDIDGAAVLLSTETFADVDTQLMTAAAIDDRIESKGYITSYTVTQSDVTTHQAALSITESQISDFGTYTNYANSDVDAHLNTSTAATNEVLSWNGTDYDWVAQSGGGGGIALTDLSVTTNSVGTAALSYNNTTGVFSYTPPDLSSYLTGITGQSIANLSDVYDSISPINNSVLQWDNVNSRWDAANGVTPNNVQSYIDTHINTSTAASNEILSWNGSDYEWIEQGIATVYSLTGTAIDPTNGGIQTKTISANTTFTETLASGESVVMMLEGAASYTITWPTITWVTSSGNSAPTLTAKDTLVLWKVSTTLYGAYVGSYA